jgi:hypothetical protein
MKPLARLLWMLPLSLTLPLAGCQTGGRQPRPDVLQESDCSDPDLFLRWLATVQEDVKAGREDRALFLLDGAQKVVGASKTLSDSTRSVLEAHLLREKIATEFTVEARRLDLRKAVVEPTDDGFDVLIQDHRYHLGDQVNDHLFLRSVDIAAEPGELTFVFKGYTLVCPLERRVAYRRRNNGVK